MRRILSPSSGAAGLALIGMASSHHTLAVTARQRTPARGTATVEWKTYGADLGEHALFARSIRSTQDNFSKLKIAWRLKTNDFGPRPDTLYSATPLFVGNVLYTTAGRRARSSRSIRHRRGALEARRRRRAARPERGAQRRRTRRRVLVERRTDRIGASST